jgi:alginate O-acetyltransferase complex protein AlgI
LDGQVNFNSPQFAVFFPIVLVLYALFFLRDRVRNIILIAASYVFYMSWNWRYAGLLIFSTVLDYYIALWIEREERQQIRARLLALTITINLGLLGVFKYYNFAAGLSRDAFSFFGLSVNVPFHQLLLPLGISFYTFETMSYTIDVYRRRIKAEQSLLLYSLYIAFWPHLVAGPVVRAADLLPQMRRTPNVTYERFHDGLLLIFRGLFKKIAIADLLAALAVDSVFSNPGRFSSWDLLMALYGYAFQIYNDFSGYTDIAIGAARMLGYDISPNFNRPYLAATVREFWTRWHISLSSWLRDYLYVELGGNRKGTRRKYINLMLTMLLGGLWHGAGLNFLFWGAYHGALLVVSHMRAASSHAAGKLMLLRKRVVTFHLIVFGWLLFRIHTMSNLREYMQGLLRLTGGTQLHEGFYGVLGLACVLHFVPKSSAERALQWIPRMPVPAQATLYLAAVLAFWALTLGAPAFIYFQF